MPNDGIGRRLVPGRDSLPAVALVGALYLFVTVFEQILSGVVSIPALSVVELTAALPIPVLLATGPAALWGIPLGYAVSDAVTGSLGPGTLVGAGAHTYLGYAACKLLRRFGPDAGVVSDPASTVRGEIGLPRFVLAVGLAAAGAAAVAGWGGELVQRTPFFVATPLAFAEFFLLSAPFALPLTRLFRRIAVASASAVELDRPDRRRFDGRFDLRWVAAVTLGWVAVGTVASVGYRTFEKVPTGTFTSRGLDAVLLLRRPELFGPGAGRLQVLLGAVLLSTLVVLFAGPTDRTGALDR